MWLVGNRGVGSGDDHTVASAYRVETGPSFPPKHQVDESYILNFAIVRFKVNFWIPLQPKPYRFPQTRALNPGPEVN